MMRELTRMAFCVWVSQAVCPSSRLQPDLDEASISGVSCLWDMEEVMAKNDEIVEGDKLKLRA